MTPDYIFPAINDGSDSSPSLSIYEFAHNLYSDQLYDWILGVILSSSYRNAFESLLYGKDYNSASYVVPSSDLPNVGYSVMRNSNTSYLLLKYGPHGDYHGHYDKGEIILYKVEKIVEQHQIYCFRKENWLLIMEVFLMVSLYILNT